MSVLLKNGLVVTAEGSFAADVFVDGEKIKAVSAGLEHKADELIDAKGKYILPGAIDPHTHLAMPFMGTTSRDDFHTGTIAAACGGTTSVVDFVLQNKGESLHDAVMRKRGIADGKVAVDYSLHPAVLDPRPDVIDEVKKAAQEYGTPSFKIFLFYDFRVDDYTMIRLLEETRKHGGLVQVHAENFDMIRRMNERLEAENKLEPYYHAMAHAAAAEEEAVDKAAKMVEFTGSRIYIVHLSSKEGLWKIKKARDRGVEMYAETCPQYLTLTDERYKEKDFGGAKYVMSPPLRGQDSVEELWLGLRGRDVHTVGTDHCPFNFKGQKDMFGKDDYKKIPNGAPGIETMLMLLHSEGVVKGRISLERMVAVTSTNTARLFGLEDKGAVAAGKDADLVVFDPKAKLTLTQSKLHQNVDYTPWEGWEVTGRPEIVYSRGKRVAEWEPKTGQMKFVGTVGAGRFVKRIPASGRVPFAEA